MICNLWNRFISFLIFFSFSFSFFLGRWPATGERWAHPRPAKLELARFWQAEPSRSRARLHLARSGDVELTRDWWTGRDLWCHELAAIGKASSLSQHVGLRQGLELARSSQVEPRLRLGLSESGKLEPRQPWASLSLAGYHRGRSPDEEEGKRKRKNRKKKKKK